DRDLARRYRARLRRGKRAGRVATARGVRQSADAAARARRARSLRRDRRAPPLAFSGGGARAGRAPWRPERRGPRDPPNRPHRVDELPILILYPHSRCNCRCVMCDIWKADSVTEISPSELERHVEDLRALRVRWVVLSGGEPLMHSDLFRLARSLKELDIRGTLLTTGLLLEKNAAAIVESIGDVIVSLDGPPEVHDRIRRVARAYELLERGVLALQARARAYPVAARCTVQRDNLRHLRATVTTARRLGLRSISF